MTDAEKRRALPWLLTAETLSMSFVMLTFGGSVFILFLDELQLGTQQIGFLLSLIPFCGLVAPLVAPLVGRFGHKRIYVTFWGIRKFVFALILFTPAILERYGAERAFWWVSGIIFTFALCRSIAETGGFQWKKEIIPNAIRGQYSALNSMTTTVSSIIVVAVAGYVIENGTGLGRFMQLMSVGLVIGLISVAVFSRVPPEQAAERHDTGREYLRGIGSAFRDVNYRRFLLILGLTTFASSASNSFIPLFMKREIGLTDGVVVLLSIGTHLGALLTSYLWGWTADRYGSKPVMQASLVLLLLPPINWLLLPAHSPASAPLAMVASFLLGVANLAWQISWTRYLYVNAIPEDNKAAYMGLYYAWFGIVSGLGPLLGGRFLQWAENAGMASPYSLLFGLSLLLLGAGAAVSRRLQVREATTFWQLANLFMHGNPVKALRFLIQFNWAGDELAMMHATERLGEAHNLLTSQELIAALGDPAFNVRYEAIHAIARLPAEPELTRALLEVMATGETELSIAAARALGKMGDPSAVPALRQTLATASSRMLAANSGRALGLLGDVESIPALLERLEQEANPHLQGAYASALGRLQATAALEPIWRVLDSTAEPTLRAELALALARMVGDERYFLQQWRQGRREVDKIRPLLAEIATGEDVRAAIARGCLARLGEEPTAELIALSRQVVRG